ncbi:MAG: DNA repair protein RadA [Clostridiales Family XIII bacterium]|jgi:DNA repair protein RadA/Sms|nr:DNA repair protein RadA [Clostridiales Family XIII bacterium]
MVTKPKTVFVCEECGFESPKWMGQCVCGAWNSFYERRVEPEGPAAARRKSSKTAGAGAGAGTVHASPLAKVETGNARRLDTGIEELNRVLGGGITAGTLTLISGEPGIGKSTLILQAAISLARRRLKALYVSGEESPEQIRTRADRIAPAGIPDGVLILSATAIETVLDAIEAERPDFLIIDSIQTMYTETLEQAPGSVSQIRVCTDMLMRSCKAIGLPAFIVAHVTKSGDLAGPKIVEHIVDCVLSFSGEKSRDLRLLTASKNRFGTTSEVGAFEMRENGLAEIQDLSGCLLEGPLGQASGTIATAVYEGTRPLLMEIQALTAGAGTGFPRRAAIGVDNARLGMILAVLERKAGLDLSGSDVYVNIVGGFRPDGTSSDLSCALAIWSAARGAIVPAGVLAIGEVGLAGEIRSVRGAESIAAEAARLGFTRLILPGANAKTKTPPGISAEGVSSILEAISLVFADPGSSPG